MRLNWVLAALLAVAAQSVQAAVVYIPTDPKASYNILSVNGSFQSRIIVTQRIGPSGISFSKREYNCENQTFRYIATGETLASLNTKVVSNWARMDPGSISWFLGQGACGIGE